MSASSKINAFLWILAALGLAASFYILSGRVAQEQTHASAELLFDYQALNDYARSNGQSLDALLRDYRHRGVTSLAVEDVSRDSLELKGEAHLVNYFELQDLQYQKRVDSSAQADPRCCYYAAKDAAAAKRIAEGAKLSFGETNARVWPREGGTVVEIKADPRLAAGYGLGISKDLVSELHRKYGFTIWVRPWNSPALTLAGVRQLIAQYQAMPGVEGIIFGGIRNEVFGAPAQIEDAAKLIGQSRLKLGVIELSPEAQQKGMPQMAKLLNNRVVRVMAISPQHQAKLDPEAAAAMFSLGVRERNIRLVYCRPYIDSVGQLSVKEANQLYLDSLSQVLAPMLNSGFCSVFSAPSMAVPGFNGWSVATVLLSLCSASGLVLLLRFLRMWPYRWGMAFLPIIALVTAVVCFTGIASREWRLLMGLMTITVFPILGYVIVAPLIDNAEKIKRFWNVLLEGWKVLAIATFFALLGGLLAAAYLPDTNFMLSLEVFRGIKLHSLVVPAAIFLIWLESQQRRGGLDGVIRFLESNVKLWHICVFMVLAALAAFYLVRTGNAGGDVVVSEGERAFRRWLDGTLGVRPRFKEFVLGNPCLVLLPALVMLRWRGVVPLAVLGSAIGLASLSDTYAHIHTPLLVSFHRTILGAAFGCLIGTFLTYACFMAKKLLYSQWKAVFKGQALAPSEASQADQI